MEEESELYKIAEACVVRDSLQLYLSKLTEQHRDHPDYALTMEFIGIIYKKFAKIASTKCERDLTGRLTVRKNIRKDFNSN